MLFANLIGIVCAACMAVGPAVSEFENNAVRSAENTSFFASPKKAYYDPAETYGNTDGYAYNYSSITLHYVQAQTGPDVPSLAENESAQYMPVSNYGNSGYGGLRFTIGDNSIEDLKLYYNGEVYTNIRFVNNAYIAVFDEAPTGYFWFFDKAEGEYGTMPGLMYNYSSLTFRIKDTTSTEVDFAPNTSTQIYSNGGTNRPTWYSAPASSSGYATQDEAQEAIGNCNYVFYKNGTKIENETVWETVYSGQYYVAFIPLTMYDTTAYYWVLDQEPAYTPVDMLGDIAEGITGGIVPVAEGIGSGLQSLVSNIFLDGDGLSTFGIVVICFAGLALALGLSRWIVNFVSSLGARDR